MVNCKEFVFNTLENFNLNTLFQVKLVCNGFSFSIAVVVDVVTQKKERRANQMDVN